MKKLNFYFGKHKEKTDRSIGLVFSILRYRKNRDVGITVYLFRRLFQVGIKIKCKELTREEYEKLI